MKLMTIEIATGRMLSADEAVPERAATFTAYLLDPEVSYRKIRRRPLMIVCPGGGYLLRATKEQEPIVARFLGLGYHVIVLRYSVYFVGRPEGMCATSEVNDASVYPGPLLELMKTVRWARVHADEYHIDQKRIYAVGFSAGGHLVGSLAERWGDADLLARIPGATAEDTKPAGVIMGYPMIGAREMLSRDSDKVPQQTSWQLPFIKQAIFGCQQPDEARLAEIDLREHVRSDMPRVFMWHTSADNVVHASDTAEFAARLVEHNVPCELHVFERGPHGMALADETSATSASDIDTRLAEWVPLAASWLAEDDPREASGSYAL